MQRITGITAVSDERTMGPKLPPCSLAEDKLFCRLWERWEGNSKI